MAGRAISRPDPIPELLGIRRFLLLVRQRFLSANRPTVTVAMSGSNIHESGLFQEGNGFILSVILGVSRVELIVNCGQQLPVIKLLHVVEKIATHRQWQPSAECGIKFQRRQETPGNPFEHRRWQEFRKRANGLDQGEIKPVAFFSVEPNDHVPTGLQGGPSRPHRGLGIRDMMNDPNGNNPVQLQILRKFVAGNVQIIHLLPVQRPPPVSACCCNWPPFRRA